MIEGGKVWGIDRNLKLCQFCNGKNIEDEYHFLLACPAYREERGNILPRFYCRWPTKNNLIKLLNENQTSIIKSWQNLSMLRMKSE